MSNIIPMVSASPPPLDEAPSFSDGWGDDDDDDDFGNFTGADVTTNETLDYGTCALPSPENQSMFSKNDSETNLACHSSSVEESPRKNPIDSLQFSGSVSDCQRKPSSLDLPKSNSQTNGTVDREPGEMTLDVNSTNDSSCENQEVNETPSGQPNTTARKRESTTDSGMCSTDISPIPISDNSADFCDAKSSASDADEMFTEVNSDFSSENPSVVLEESLPASSSHKHSSHTSESSSNEIVPDCSSQSETSHSHEGERTVDNQGQSKQLSCESVVSHEALDQLSSCQDKSTKLSSDDMNADDNNDEWSGFVDISSATQSDRNSNCNEDVECSEGKNNNVHQSQVLEQTERRLSGNETVTAVADSEQVDNSETVMCRDSDINDNTDSDSGEHLSKHIKNEEVEDLQLPDINNIEDEETSSEVKSESESDQLQSEQSSDAQIESSDDCGKFQTADLEEEAVVRSRTENAFAAFPTDDSAHDDNWADFSSAAGPVIVTDDVDDFGDFSLPAESQEKLPSESQKVEKSFSDNNVAECHDEVDDEDDDFGDFSQPAETGEKLPSESQKAEESFSDNNVAECHDEVDDDEFGDFSTGGFQETPTVSASFSEGWADSQGFVSATHSAGIKETSQLQADKQEKVGRVLSTCFPHPSGGWGELGSFVDLLDNMVEKAPPKARLPKTLPVPEHQKTLNDSSKELENVWLFLRDMEKSLAGRYEWAESSGNKKLFKTLRIDARNVLMWGSKKPGLPIYAASLGLLEPMRDDQRGPGQDVKKVDTLVDTSKTDTSITAVNQDIPPAQFDWNGSGLTNPLDAKSSLLDLDLLAVNDGKSGGESKPKVFESDLLGRPECSKAPPKTLQPLETILATMKFNPTIKQVKADENLSTEAARVINTLPDLSFMQAKVLMFPLRTVSEGSVGGGT
ncbi:aftiphilin-like [Liolophura sinensis]|uniref:aftiphilin-like n=1 Tax=Liolophura sinensis TaxID=3198878 RepID=UPI00315966D6